jgi:hypothetical protein
MARKLKSPYFVKAELRKDGTVFLTDDDGEVFIVEMRRDQEWPMLSSRVRPREMRATIEKMAREQWPKPPPPAPTKPRLVS